MCASLVATEDGSLSLKDRQSGELFHNRAGAYSEALTNFVAPALSAVRGERSLSAVDVCFGLGYNSFVLVHELMRVKTRPIRVHIVAFERDLSLLAHLPRALDSCPLRDLASLVGGHLDSFIHSGVLDLDLPGVSVKLELRPGDLRQLVPLEQAQANIVFHDPFSASRQPELWTQDLFAHYFRLLKERQGVVVTYSAASAVRGGLREAGFELWRTAALGGKSGGTLACVPGAPVDAEFCLPLDEAERAKLESRSGVPYRDPGLNGGAKEILRRRQDEQATSANGSWPSPAP